MKTNSVLFLLPAAFLLGADVKSSAQDSQIELCIHDVTARYNPRFRGPTGVMILQFANEGVKEANIMVSCPVYGDTESNNHTIKVIQVLNRGKPHLPGCDFATVEYDWYDRSNARIAGSQTDLTGADIKIDARQQSQMVYVPIDLPTLDGEYTLRVVFDNTRLLKEARTHGDFDQRNVYVKAPAQIHLQVTARSNAPTESASP